jgi:ABC-type cobalamin/Fe3+-siderophores transport system ATPase subunit
MTNQIQRFKVVKLFGEKTYDITFKDNKLILIAENGMGKSTVLRILYYYLAQQWENLSKNDFERLEITIDDETYSLNKEDLDKKPERDNKALKKELKEKFKIYQKVVELMVEDFSDLKDFKSIRENADIYLSKYDMPPSTFFRIIEALEQSTQKVVSLPISDFQIIYLPTYRRIEKSFQEIFPKMADNLEKKLSTEVSILSAAIEAEDDDDKADIPKDDLRHYENSTREELQMSLDDFFNNLDDSRWELRFHQEKNKTHCFELVDFGIDDVVDYVEKQVQTFKGTDDEKLKQSIDTMVKVCQKYLGKHKSIVITDTIKVKLDNNIKELSVLSSGEKQIIALFAHLCFSSTPSFIIIDEPELSLSIYWQETIIEDILSLNCNGLVAATHSPFVVTDKLKPLAYALGGFLETY